MERICYQPGYPVQFYSGFCEFFFTLGKNAVVIPRSLIQPTKLMYQLHQHKKSCLVGDFEYIMSTLHNILVWSLVPVVNMLWRKYKMLKFISLIINESMRLCPPSINKYFPHLSKVIVAEFPRSCFVNRSETLSKVTHAGVLRVAVTLPTANNQPWVSSLQRLAGY